MSLISRLLPRPGAPRLTPLDASFLYYERPTALLHVGSVGVLEGQPAFEALRDVLAARLAGLPRLRQRPMRPLLDVACPQWEEAPGFDARDHVRAVRCDAPGDLPALRATVERLFVQRLDPGRPLWETWVIEGVGGNRTAILSKVHHCMIDGVSGAQVLEVMTDQGAAEAAVGPGLRAVASEAYGLWQGAVAAALGTARAAAAALTTVAELTRNPLSPMPWNGALSGQKHVVWATLPLDDVLAMRGAAGCKVNDVVLAIIAGAIRRQLGAPSSMVRAMIPVSLRRIDERLALGNRVSAILASLPVDVADPLERLARVAAEMRRRKEEGQAEGVSLLTSLAGGLPSQLASVIAGAAERWPVVHTVCTNVPGPRETRTVMGHPVAELHPIVPLGLGLGLGFAILSYGHALSICATADVALVPGAGALAEAIQTEFAELRDRLGIDAPMATVETAGPPVAALMTGTPMTVSPDATLARAWDLMQAHRIRHLPVVDAQGRLVGLVTHRDLLAASQSTLTFRAETDRVRLLAGATVGDVMETHLSVTRPEEPAVAAGGRMGRHKIGCLPVLGPDGRLLGIVTQEDFLRWATDRMASHAA